MATKEQVEVMKSPFTGGDAKLCHEPSVLTFRKEQFSYMHQFYECQDTHERFTTTELDETNIAQVYNQYRAKYGIPFPEEIKRIHRRKSRKQAIMRMLGRNT